MAKKQRTATKYEAFLDCGWPNQYAIINANRSATTTPKPWTARTIGERYVPGGVAYFARQRRQLAHCAATTSGFRSDADYKRLNWFTCRWAILSPRKTETVKVLSDSRHLLQQYYSEQPGRGFQPCATHATQGTKRDLPFFTMC